MDIKQLHISSEGSINSITQKDKIQDCGKAKLRRQLTLAHGVAVICGLIIGSGIYVSPGGVIRGTGSVGLALIIWVLAGIMGTIGALCFAELGTTYPKSGEKYVYLTEMYGEFAGFLYLWVYLLLFRPGGNTIKALTFARYAVQPLYPECTAPYSSVILLAIAFALVITFINIVSVKWAANGQMAFVSITLILLSAIGVIGIVYIIMGHTEYIKPPESFYGTSHDLGAISLAFYSAIFASWGWNALNFLVDELIDPYKNLPRALYISMALVTSLYFLVNLAYFTVLGPEVVAESPAVAVTFVHTVFGPLAWVVSIGVAFSCFGSFNSGILVGSRLAFAGAKQGHLPEALALINIRFLSPVISLLFQMFLVVVMSLLLDVYTIMNYMIFANNLIDVLCMAGMIYFRLKQPNLHRPLKFSLVLPVVFLLCLLFLTCVTVLTRPHDVIYGVLIILCTAVPYYLVIIKCRHKLPRALLHTSASFTILMQKLLYAVRSTNGNDHPESM